MAFTDPINVANWILGEILGHAGLLSRVNLVMGRKAGKSIQINVPQASSTDTVDGALLTADQDNTVLSLTATDEARRIALSLTEYNDWLADSSYRMTQIEQMTDDLRISMENALDTAFATATRTTTLATSNSPTIGEIMGAAALALEGGAQWSDLSMIWGATGWGNAMTAGFANAGGSLTRPGQVGDIAGIPCFVSAQCTTGGTGDPAGYLWARQGIQAAIAGVAFLGPQGSALTGTWDVSALLSHAFALNSAVGTRFVHRFNNPS